MSLRWKVHTPTTEEDISVTINEHNPLRIALLGGAKSGKLSIASRLSFGLISDTYYPTISTNPVLFHYTPLLQTSRGILDPGDAVAQHSKYLPHTQIGPMLENFSASGTSTSTTTAEQHRKKVQSYRSEVHTEWIIKNRTEIYKCIENRAEVLAHADHPLPPIITPILVEFIDTPPFNPDQVVPFLEASLYMKLDPEILRNLANEPSKPTLTNPLLVASGAGEMNGYIDGYFFVYSSIPSYEPPLYGQATADNTFPSLSSISSPGATRTPVQSNSFRLLEIIKEALEEAWIEYNNFRKNWAHGEEGDIFLLKGAFKGLLSNNKTKVAPIPEAHVSETDNLYDPSNPYCPPPIWVICTHIDSELTLPTLVQNGKDLARKWKCGFIGVDCSKEDGGVEEAMALMIREIIERKKLQKKLFRKHGK